VRVLTLLGMKTDAGKDYEGGEGEVLQAGGDIGRRVKQDPPIPIPIDQGNLGCGVRRGGERKRRGIQQSSFFHWTKPREGGMRRVAPSFLKRGGKKSHKKGQEGKHSTVRHYN